MLRCKTNRRTVSSRNHRGYNARPRFGTYQATSQSDKVNNGGFFEAPDRRFAPKTYRTLQKVGIFDFVTQLSITKIPTCNLIYVRQKMKNPLILASDYGSIALAGIIIQIVVVGFIISLLSLIFALPKKIRNQGRWHSWTALVISIIAVILASYFTTLMKTERGWDSTDILLTFLLFSPVLLASISVWITSPRKK